MKRIILASLLAATPVAAQQKDSEATPVDLSGKSLDELIEIVSDTKEWWSKPCSMGTPLFAELEKHRPGNPFINRGALLSAALCDDLKGNYAQGLEKTRILEKVAPDEDFSWLAFYFARRSENAEEYLTSLRALDEQTISKIEPDSFWAGTRMVARAGLGDELEQLYLDWYDKGLFFALHSDMEEGVAKSALVAAVGAKRLELAPSLLAVVRSPSSYVAMLSDRRYEAIWPVIEEHAGANLERVSAEYAEWALARLGNAEEDRDRFSDAAHGLHFAGRYQDAIDLAQRWLDRDGALASIQEGDAWALNIQAYAYDALGRREEADRVLDLLAEQDPEEHNWVVNFVINRASRLVGYERWEEGLAAAHLAREVTEMQGSPYAKMIVSRDHVCALSALGRPGEIAADLEFLRTNPTESHILAAQGLMCAGYRGEASELLLRGLTDKTYRSDIVGQLQPQEFSLFYSPSQLPNPRELLAENPELKAAFEAHGRIVPERFVPVAYLKRASR
ncbi:MAG: hypothetical protein R3E14_09865 [Erythrobacter sp.]